MRSGSLLLVGVVGSTLLTACGSGSTALLTPVGPTDVRCGVTIVPIPSTINAAGGTGALKIDTARECRWSVSGSAGWFTFKSAVEGQGPAEVPFAVASNQSTEPRRIELVVADQRVVISQEAAKCSWKLTPETVSPAATGGEVRATLATEDYCSWTATPRAPWMEITSEESGKGTAEISVMVSENSGAERSGTVEFSPSVFLVIRQQALPTPTQAVPTPTPLPSPAPGTCSFDVTPSKFDNVVPDASDLFVDVKTTANCGWTASSPVTWIAVSPLAGTGTGRAKLSVQSNPGASRSVSVLVAGKTVTVNQKAVVPCTYTLNPTSLHLSNSAQTSAINVTTNKPTCSMNAVSNAAWIRVGTFPATGGGKIPLTVDRNDGTKRSATITVSGTNFSQAVKVDQDGR
jgi:hypothetical protein